MLVTDEAKLAGVPTHVLEAARERALTKNENGYRLNLEFPCYFPIICYCDNAEIREQMYTAYVTRASDQGPQAHQWDNSDNMAKIVNLRHEKAVLLGFENYAQYSLATKMAKEPQEVLKFLRDLASKARPQAQKEWQNLQDFAKKKHGVTQLQPWDLNYYREKLRIAEFEVSEEEIRPYFPSDKVIAGLFTVVEKLFNVKIQETRDADVWHPDVKFYSIYDDKQQLQAHFYFDLYARPNKRGGAWMDECRVRWRDANGQLQLPVAYLTCNFAGPSGGKPALWNHDEVITLFHEFGHGLHHMMTRIEYPEVSGINGVCWDAVEFPSQFLENWCWQPQALDFISSHFETHEPLPKTLLTRMLNAKNFQSASAMVRQLEFGLFDFELHSKTKAKISVQEIQDCLSKVRAEVSVIPVPSFNRFQHSFNHIFSGGYGAGYYSYHWAEVLAADAFARFEQEGIFNPKTGRDFLNYILEKGGSQEPMDLFIAFRGREPHIEPLLKHHGIIASP
jgi:oligopeptidase A